MAGPSTRKYIVEKIAALKAQQASITADLEAFERVLAVIDAEAISEEAAGVPATVANAILGVLQEAGKPLHYTVILQQLQRRGVQVKGLDPAKNVGAHMSIDPRFVSNGKGFWGLKSWGGTPPGRVQLPAGAQPGRVVPLPQGQGVPVDREGGSVQNADEQSWENRPLARELGRAPTAG